MISRVENEREQKIFDSIWMEVWDEKGFEHETTEGEAYLLYVEEQPAGTVQFIPYDPEQASELHRVFDFSEIERVRNSGGRVFIIDKFAIVKAFRSTSALDLLMFSLFEYAEKRRQLYAVALLDPLLYRLIRFHYHFKVERVGGRTEYKGAEVIPILIDSRYFLDRKGEFDWYKEAAAAMSGG